MKLNHFRPIYFAATVLAALVLTSVGYPQTNAALAKIDNDLKEDLQSGPCKNGDRFEAVKTLFKKMGVAEADIKVDKYKDIQNVTMTKKGKTAETVIIGAHYDKVSTGCGIIDNWSGIVILGHLFRALNAKETQKTYMFVAFDQEETGLKGSSALAKSIPKENRSSYCSMVNLDSFGLGYPYILENASSKKMIQSAKDLAAELKMPITGLNLEGMADADSSSFKKNDISAITLSALSDKWHLYMHSANDQMEHVNVSSVRIGYLFALEYLTRIDAGGCSMYR